MTIDAHWGTFAGYKVEEWQPGKPLTNLDKTIYRIAVEYDEKMTWQEKFNKYMAEPNAKESRGLITGAYSEEMYEEDCTGPMQAIIAVKDQLPLLDALFINDITYEENEISWIVNTDNAPIIHAFPNLKYFGTRGGNGLRFNHLNAPNLEMLMVQSGGMAAETIQDIASANLPNLKHLELYLGTDDYGYTGSVADLQAILDDKFNQLTYLGLKNCDQQDQIAKAVVSAAVVNHLEVLDLSLGTLTDEGGEAILTASSLNNLKKLDLTRHYLTNDMMDKLAVFAQQQGFVIEMAEQEEADEYENGDGTVEYWRYVSIGE